MPNKYIDDLTLATQAQIDAASIEGDNGSASFKFKLGREIVQAAEAIVPRKFYRDPADIDYIYPYHQIQIDIGALPNNSTALTAHGMADYFPASVELKGIAYNSSNGEQPQLGYAALSGGNIQFRIDSTTNVRVTTSSNRSGFVGWGTVQFAKTTDTKIYDPLP